MAWGWVAAIEGAEDAPGDAIDIACLVIYGGAGVTRPGSVRMGVRVPETAGLAAVRDAMVAAVRAYAAGEGWDIPATRVMLPAFQRGG